MPGIKPLQRTSSLAPGKIARRISLIAQAVLDVRLRPGEKSHPVLHHDSGPASGHSERRTLGGVAQRALTSGKGSGSQ